MQSSHLPLILVILSGTFGALHAFEIVWNDPTTDCYPTIYVFAKATYEYYPGDVHFEVSQQFSNGIYLHCWMDAYKCEQIKDETEVGCKCLHYEKSNDQYVQLIGVSIRGKWLRASSNILVQLFEGNTDTLLGDGPRYLAKKELIQHCSRGSVSGGQMAIASPMTMFALLTATAMFRC